MMLYDVEIKHIGESGDWKFTTTISFQFGTFAMAQNATRCRSGCVFLPVDFVDFLDSECKIPLIVSPSQMNPHACHLCWCLF